MDNLHDSNPKQKWDNNHYLRKIIWLVIYISLLIFISIIPMENWSQKVLILILITLLGVLFYFILKKLENEFIYTIWDDVDYSGIIKKDFPFEPIPGEKILVTVFGCMTTEKFFMIIPPSPIQHRCSGVGGRNN